MTLCWWGVQRLMDTVLVGCPEANDTVLVGCTEFTPVYIDDILVVSGSWAEHKVHLGKLFEVLKEAGLTVKRKKCSFGRVKLEFLGHVTG